MSDRATTSVAKACRAGFAVLGLMAMVVMADFHATLGAGPAGQEWLGQRVVPKIREFTLRDTIGGPARAAKIAIYRVDKAQNGSFRLKAEGGDSGWVPETQVVRVEQAVAYFSSRIRTSPRVAYNYTMRAMIQLFEGEDATHALADCDIALRLDPDDALAHGVRGAARAAVQNYSGALTDFSDVIRLKPKDPDAYRDRGVARMSNRDFDGALADFTEAIRLDPASVPALMSRATAWMTKNDHAKAVADFDEAIRLNPSNPEAYFLRASVKGQIGDLDAAIADFSQVIKLDPQISLAYQARANAWRGKRDYAHAIADLDIALRSTRKTPVCAWPAV